MSSKKSKTKTVSQKIADSFLPKATPDPENDPDNLVKIATLDDDDERQLEFDNTPSEIRKRNAKLLSDFSDRYKGKVTSRKELESSDDTEQSVEGDSDEDDSDTNEVEKNSNESEEAGMTSEDSEDSELETYKKQLNSAVKKQSVEKVESNSEENSDGSIEDNETDGKDDRESNASDSTEDEQSESDEDNTQSENDGPEDDSQIISEANQKEEIQKGLAVQNQLKIWEKLLEIRIHSQKMLTKANSLPPPRKFNELSDLHEDFRNSAKETTQTVATLLENMLEMRLAFANQYSEIRSIVQPKRKRSSHASTAEPPIKRFADILGSDYESLKPYRNSVLQKWDDRTKILAPSAAGKKGGGRSLSDNFDIIRKIDAVLMNKNDLLNKSRTVQGNYKLFSERDPNEQDGSQAREENEQKQNNETVATSPEIYDDTDFYHQQLRELIEYKSNTSSNPAEVTRQFAELQKLRQKMKKKVDTRASKGRKIRYVVHNKLVNFMAPNSSSEWPEESKTELYRSVFAT